MRILFDLRKVGLGNNGGSSTLVKSGNTLVEMGHEIYFIDSMRNQHKWTPLKAKHLIVNHDDSRIPDADFIIATGYKSVGTTINAPERCGRKVHWIRAWEHWQMRDQAIVDQVLKVPTIKLVNSICLKKKLKKYGFDSYIIYPGYDFGELYPKHIRGKGSEVIIGGLYREGVHGQRKRTGWLFEVARKLKTRDKNIKFWLFGSEQKPVDFMIDNYLRSPTPSKKNNFYNMIDIWMAPTMSEGLHLPPAEAMLTECPVIATKAELSGVQDYIIEDETGVLSENDLHSFIQDVEYLYKHKETRLRLGKAGREKILEIGDRRKNMQNLIDLFERIKDENI
jgi:glycosyltransferase involved in cell wall biosynthesis